eukprot:scaffold178447_cov36-Tisochrysis_lutea.AAC.1
MFARPRRGTVLTRQHIPLYRLLNHTSDVRDHYMAGISLGQAGVLHRTAHSFMLAESSEKHGRSAAVALDHVVEARVSTSLHFQGIDHRLQPLLTQVDVDADEDAYEVGSNDNDVFPIPNSKEGCQPVIRRDDEARDHTVKQHKVAHRHYDMGHNDDEGESDELRHKGRWRRWRRLG